jgi:hypothetical protein
MLKHCFSLSPSVITRSALCLLPWLQCPTTPHDVDASNGPHRPSTNPKIQMAVGHPAWGKFRLGALHK